jgi:hypothetical protein
MSPRLLILPKHQTTFLQLTEYNSRCIRDTDILLYLRHFFLLLAEEVFFFLRNNLQNYYYTTEILYV